MREKTYILITILISNQSFNEISVAYLYVVWSTFERACTYYILICVLIMYIVTVLTCFFCGLDVYMYVCRAVHMVSIDATVSYACTRIMDYICSAGYTLH